MNTEAMLTKTEFKFDCPKCGQHILVATDWVGLGISCPSCQTRITIPSPPSGETSAKPATSPQPTKTTIRIELPPKPPHDSAGPNGKPVGPKAGAAIVPRRVTGNEPWPELLQHLENGALAEPAVLATALFCELTNVRRRLDQLEKQILGVQQPQNTNALADK